MYRLSQYDADHHFSWHLSIHTILRLSWTSLWAVERDAVCHVDPGAAMCWYTFLSHIPRASPELLSRLFFSLLILYHMLQSVSA